MAETQQKLDYRPLGKAHLQATLSLEVLVTAATDGDGNPKPEPCCVCYKVKAGYICTGDCCKDVLDDQVVDVEPI